MTLSRLAAVAAIAAVLVACASPQERAAFTIKVHGPYCEGLGYKKDTDQWRQCIQNESTRAALE